MYKVIYLDFAVVKQRRGILASAKAEFISINSYWAGVVKRINRSPNDCVQNHFEGVIAGTKETNLLPAVP